MYFQQRYLKEGETFGSSTTGLETIELPNKGLLSGIGLRVYGTNGDSAADPDVWLHNRLRKIELIVNGSKVVKSLSGDQLLADMLYKRTPHYSHDMKNMNNASAEEFFYINLGRHYHDLDYLLDLGKVNDPELRIDYNFGMTSHNGWSNGVAMAAAPSYSVIPHLLKDAPFTPKGYLKTSEVYRFTSGALKKENMTIPRGPMYSNLYLQIFYASHGLTLDLDKLELNINSDDIIPIRLGVQELLAILARQYGLFLTTTQCMVTGSQAYPHPLEVGYLDGHIGTNEDAEIGRNELWGYMTGVAITKPSTGATLTTTHNATLHYTGCLPFGIAAIPYFDPWDPRTWIDSSKLGDLWLRVEEVAGAASSVPKLLADEVVTKYEPV